MDLLTEAEIIIVPDSCMYEVPFAALTDEGGKYLSQTIRIRIFPSLTTLKIIQDCSLGYHIQIGALVVGDPEVGSGSQCVRKEAEMIGRLLGVKPLVGDRATKQAALETIDSVSPIHLAAHPWKC